MVFSFEDKIIIKNDYLEKDWNAYEIWREHPSKGWNRFSVRRLIKRFEETGTMERKQGSGRPITVTTDENTEVVEELICSQEEEPGSHKPPRSIAKDLEIGHSSVRRIIENKNINQFKRSRAPDTNPGTKKRRVERAACLAD